MPGQESRTRAELEAMAGQPLDAAPLREMAPPEWDQVEDFRARVESAFKRRQSIQAAIEQLVEERQRNRLTQEEVARRMGTTQSAVARLETGSSDPRVSTLYRYARAVGCVLDLQVKVLVFA